MDSSSFLVMKSTPLLPTKNQLEFGIPNAFLKNSAPQIYARIGLYSTKMCIVLGNEQILLFFSSFAQLLSMFSVPPLSSTKVFSSFQSQAFFPSLVLPVYITLCFCYNVLPITSILLCLCNSFLQSQALQKISPYRKGFLIIFLQCFTDVHTDF